MLEKEDQVLLLHEQAVRFVHGVVSLCFVRQAHEQKGCEQIDWEELSVADFRSRA